MSAASHSGVLAKFADNLILAANYDKDRKLVDTVRSQADGGRTLGARRSQSRAEIVQALKQGHSFSTAYKNEVQITVKGLPVSLVSIKGVDYLKTTNDGEARDTLENVPGF